MFPFPSMPRRRERRSAGVVPTRLSTLPGATIALLLVALAACGGGTSQYQPFQPERLFAFGDEASALTTDAEAPAGRNYGINGINTNNTEDTADDFDDCRLQPNWTQSLAASYGFVFAECNRDNVAVPQARNWAAKRAKVT